MVGDHEPERLSRGESGAEFGVINLELPGQWQKDVVLDSFAPERGRLRFAEPPPVAER